MEPDHEPLKLPKPEKITGFYFEVLNALHGDTVGHPAHGSFTYHKTAECYALFGDDFYDYPNWNSDEGTDSSPGFEHLRSASSSANQPKNPLPKPSGQSYVATILGRGNTEALSQLYLKVLQQQVPQQHKRQQQQQLVGGSQNMSMPIYGLANGNAFNLTQAYTQLLMANLRHQTMLQQMQQQQQQHVQQQQQQLKFSNAATAAILYEGMLQQRVLLLQQLSHQQTAQLQPSQQLPRIPPEASNK
ncbi:mediator of RNA polymerase II transcription subunit 15 isoform X2 [Drosophila grimshawi]|nr:mediator of RNA polymerase II transcription subunit 15 isoform X2 [Drosophila grimshawi]